MKAIDEDPFPAVAGKGCFGGCTHCSDMVVSVGIWKTAGKN